MGRVGVFPMNWYVQRKYRLVEVLSGGVWAGRIRRDEACDQSSVGFPPGREGIVRDGTIAVSLSEFSLPQDHANLQPDSVSTLRIAPRSNRTKVVKRSKLAIVQGYVGNI